MTAEAVKDSSEVPSTSLTLTLAVIELVGGEVLERSAVMLQELSTHGCFTAMIMCRSGGSKDFNAALYPNVKVVENAGETIPKRRLSALEQSNSDIICIIEDTMTITPSWVESVMGAYDRVKTGAAWGPIKIASDLSPRNWALAVLEYGRYLQQRNSLQYGDIIPGCCMTFRSAALKAALDTTDTGLYEQAVAESLVKKGWQINYQVELASIYTAEDRYSSKLSTRMNHGRLYAGNIAKDLGLVRKIFSVARSILVPVIFVFRGVRDSHAMHKDGLSFMKFFWLVILSMAWGFGEIVGYALGSGNSIRSWR